MFLARQEHLKLAFRVKGKLSKSFNNDRDGFRENSGKFVETFSEVKKTAVASVAQRRKNPK